MYIYIYNTQFESHHLYGIAEGLMWPYIRSLQHSHPQTGLCGLPSVHCVVSDCPSRQKM